MTFTKQKKHIIVLFCLYLFSIAVGLLVNYLSMKNFFNMGYVFKIVAVIFSLVLFSLRDIKSEVITRFLEVTKCRGILYKWLFQGFSGLANLSLVFSIFIVLNGIGTVLFNWLLSFLIVFLAFILRKIIYLTLNYYVVSYPTGEKIDCSENGDHKLDEVYFSIYSATNDKIYTYKAEERITQLGFKYYLILYGDDRLSLYSPMNFTEIEFAEMYRKCPQIKKGYALWCFNHHVPNDVPVVIPYNYQYRYSERPNIFNFIATSLLKNFKQVFFSK